MHRVNYGVSLTNQQLAKDLRKIIDEMKEICDSVQ